MKMSLGQMIAILCILSVGFITVAPLVQTTDATWDKATRCRVDVSVYDYRGLYCHTYVDYYYVPDTSTKHYKFYHMGPRTPDSHPYPHTATLKFRSYLDEEDLDTRCDGTDPYDPNYYVSNDS